MRRAARWLIELQLEDGVILEVPSSVTEEWLLQDRAYRDTEFNQLGKYELELSIFFLLLLEMEDYPC